MKALYWIKSSTPFSRTFLKKKLDSLSIDYELKIKSECELFLYASSDISLLLEGIFIVIGENEGVKVSALKTHNFGELASKCVDEVLSFYPNRVRYISDILFKELSFGNYSLFPYLTNEFKKIDSTILLTIGTYLRCNLHINEACENLYIHRNTFRYRLKKFASQTNIDISSYHDILLLEFYFQLGNNKF